MGITLNRSVLVLCVLSCPIFISWLYAEHIFRFIGIADDVCEVIGVYLRIRAYAIPIDCFNESYEKYMMSVGVNNPAAYANVINVVSLVLFNTFFIHSLGWSFEALAYSWVLATLVNGLAQIAFSYDHPSIVRTLQPFPSTLAEWKELTSPRPLIQFITLGIPGTLMLCSEWWAYEFLTIFAGMLGTSEGKTNPNLTPQLTLTPNP